jgi:hypothetical protein
MLRSMATVGLHVSHEIFQNDLSGYQLPLLLALSQLTNDFRVVPKVNALDP